MAMPLTQPHNRNSLEDLRPQTMSQMHQVTILQSMSPTQESAKVNGKEAAWLCCKTPSNAVCESPCLKRNPASSAHCAIKECGHKRCNNCLDSPLEDLPVPDPKRARATAISIPTAKGKRWLCCKTPVDAVFESPCLQRNPASSARCSGEDCGHQQCIDCIDSPFEDLPLLKEQVWPSPVPEAKLPRSKRWLCCKTPRNAVCESPCLKPNSIIRATCVKCGHERCLDCMGPQEEDDVVEEFERRSRSMSGSGLGGDLGSWLDVFF